MRRALIFDLDGTLIDAFADIQAAINGPLSRRGLPTHDLDSIRSMVGDGAGKLIERASPAADVEMLAEITREMMDYYYQHPADLAFVYTGVFPMLDRLRALDIPMGILSNKPHPMTLKTCDQHGLGDYFQRIQGENGSASPRKPDPRALLGLRDELGVEEVIMIGDGVPDGKVAAAAGMPFVACLWGTRTREQLAEFSPVAVAEDVLELSDILTKMVR